jgi:acetyl esterase
MDDYIDPGAAALLADAAADPAAKDWWQMTPSEAREAMSESVALMCGPVPVTEVRDIELAAPHGTVSARLYRPSAEPSPFLVFFHGGGWEVGTVDIYDAPIRRLATESGFAILSVEYRLAPEDPFPAGLDDCYAAAEWAFANVAGLGGSGGFFAVAGDSSGGNLAAAVAQCSRDRGGPRIDHQLLVYPVVTRDFDSASYQQFGEGFALTRRTMQSFWDLYVGEATPPYSDLYAAGSLAGLPPATIVTVSLDPLRTEGEEYAERLAAAGVPTTLVRVYGLLHGGWLQDATGDRAYQLGHDLAGVQRRAAVSPQPL